MRGRRMSLAKFLYSPHRMNPCPRENRGGKGMPEGMFLAEVKLALHLTLPHRHGVDEFEPFF